MYIFADVEFTFQIFISFFSFVNRIIQFLKTFSKTDQFNIDVDTIFPHQNMPALGSRLPTLGVMSFNLLVNQLGVLPEV